MAAAQAISPVNQYNGIMQECQRLMTKIAELEVDRNEHQLVEEALAPLDTSRRAYRLVGEVLVERTVGEVLPSVTSNRANVSFSSGNVFSISFILE
jgi:prefoldin subunit 2